MNFFSIIDFFEKYQGLATWLSTFATLFTFIIAWRALTTWKNQKEYDLLVDNLSHCNFARTYITELRSLFALEHKSTDREIKVELAKIDSTNHTSDYAKWMAKRVVTIQSRQKSNEAIRQKFMELRERNVVYGTEHAFYKFYDYIISLDFEILNKANYLYHLADATEDLHDPDFQEQNEKIKSIIYHHHPDTINDKIDKMILGLEKFRIKRRKYF